MELETIGIIGYGFLGRAFVNGFSLHANIKIYDKYNDLYDTLEDTVNSSKYLFIGVPTPMSDDGSQDQSYLNDAISSINEVANKRSIIVIRSTIIPGTTRKLAEKYPDHDFVFTPEFLTERQANLDFINATRIIFGGDPRITKELETFYRTRFSCTPIYHTNWEAAEVVKYMCNCFYAVKLSFLNEMYDIAEHINTPFDELRDMWLSSGWIGNMHTDVPGHDGDRGYGGKCFPKDVRAFVDWAEKKGLKNDMCKMADEVNIRVRTNKDWEEIKGATSSNGYKLKEQNTK